MQFTQNFFNPEIREGFEISAMMKRAWAAQMEVLQEVLVLGIDEYIKKLK